MVRAAWLAAAAAVVFAGCGVDQYTQTQETPDFIISLTNTPAHPRVGDRVDLYATLRKDRMGVMDCEVAFMQQPESGSSQESAGEAIDMESAGRGVYRAQSRPFDAGGRWVFDFTINCTGVKRRLRFPLSIEAAQVGLPPERSHAWTAGADTVVT